jgi:hypothetical protein
MSYPNASADTIISVDIGMTHEYRLSERHSVGACCVLLPAVEGVNSESSGIWRPSIRQRTDQEGL